MSVYTNSSSSSPAEIKQYTSAVLDLLGKSQPLKVLSGTERSLRATVKRLSKRQLSKREAPGKWSIAHVVQHLADSEIVFAWRLRMILAHEQPPIQGYDQDLWANNLAYEKADAAHSLDTFGAVRGANLRLLKRATPAQLERFGIHAERGQESVAHLMRLYAGHDLLHLRQVKRIKDSL
jgi:hypothetical protein